MGSTTCKERGKRGRERIIMGIRMKLRNEGMEMEG